ncbi:MAG: hypothetical protein ACM308_02815 [Qipengyuania vulgaris]
MRPLVVVAAALLLSACVSARMHSEAELNSAAMECGFALGQLAQDEEEKRLLFIMEANPSAQKQVCVKKWARRNGLRPVFIDAVDWVTE